MINNSRICVIDIGSNSVRVLIADVDDGHILRLYSNLNTTRLYENISEDGYLNDSSIERTVSAIQEYVAIAYTHGVEDCFLFATAAVRVAQNKEVFISQVKDKTGLEIDLIDEKREALLAFAGVGYDDMRGIIDIGGASTEIAIGENAKVLASDSFKLGAVKCKEILGDDSGDIVGRVRELLVCDKYQELVENNKKYTNKEWFGVGGTITTVAAMIKELEIYDSEIINSTSFNLDDINKLIDKLQGMTIDERKLVAGLSEKRADIIVFGMAILANICKDYNISEITASDNGNMVGYLLVKMKEND